MSSTVSGVSVPSQPSLMPPYGFTVEAWVRYTPNVAWGGLASTLVWKKTAGGTVPYNLYVRPSDSAIVFILGTTQGTGVVISSSPMTSLTWTHIAATWDGTEIRLYVNGALSASTPHGGVMVQSTSPLYICCQDGNSNYIWRGRIDELRIWRYARTASQINDAMFNQLDADLGLVASWHFNGSFLDETGGNVAQATGNAELKATSSPVNPLQLIAPGISTVDTNVNFHIRGTPSGAPYFFDNTFNGTSMGTPLTAPLNGIFPLDGPLLNLTYGGLAPGIFNDYLGFTDGNGEAFPEFSVPNFPNLVGMEMNSAFLFLQTLSPMVLGEISQVVTTRFVTADPVFSAIAPANGPKSTPWPVTISGQNFDPNTIVYFRDQMAGNIVVHSPSLITCDVPPYPFTGSAYMEIVSPYHDIIHVNNVYTYIDDLVISSVSPITAAPGTLVTLIGTGITPGASVIVGSIPALVVSHSTAQSTTTIQFIMPSGLSCHASLVVTNLDGRSDTRVMNAGPFISSTISTQGPAVGGGTFYVIGGNFVPGVQVSVGGATATILSQTFTVLTVSAPPGAVGSAAVDVTNPDGCVASATYFYQ